MSATDCADSLWQRPNEIDSDESLKKKGEEERKEELVSY